MQFEAFNRTEGKTEKTVEWYNHSLRLFAEYLDAQGLSSRLKDLDIDVVRSYILYLQTRPRYAGHPNVQEQAVGLSPASVENHARAIRAFFNWLHREEYTDKQIQADTQEVQTLESTSEARIEVEVVAMGCIQILPGKITNAHLRCDCTARMCGASETFQVTGILLDVLHIPDHVYPNF